MLNAEQGDRGEGGPWATPPGLETRWATPENPRGRPGSGGRSHGGRKGSAAFFLRPGEGLTLAREEGRPGTIRRIWMTLSDLRPTMLRSLRLRMHWDGSAEPAVDVPLGDFFGHSLGRMARFESALFSSPEGRSLCCFAPMPFRSGMRVTLANEGTETLYQLYYEIDYTLGDPHGEGLLYFHARYRCENPTAVGEDFPVLPEVRGRGRFLGAFLGVAADTGAYGKSWWGEGECKIWLDGDGEWPSLCGTGTEDWIGTAWEFGPAWSARDQGCHLSDGERFRYGFYRFHLGDPVVFRERIRVAMQQIGSWNPRSLAAMRASGRRILRAGPGSGAGSEGGARAIDLEAAEEGQPYGLFERQDCWSCCAYFCLDRPESGLPPLDPVEKRLADIPDRAEMDGRAQRNVPAEILLLATVVPAIETIGLEDLLAIRDGPGPTGLRRAADVIAAAILSQEAVLLEAGIDHD